MRITIHLSTFSKTNPCAYAILWIDRDAQRWSGESHFGLDLPTWGIVHSQPGVTLLCGQRDDAPLCELDGLAMDSDGGPFEGEAGGARWCSDKARGHWHVQCVDEALALPEYGIFAEDEGR